VKTKLLFSSIFVDALCSGAVLAVIGLLTGKTLAIGILGGVFVAEVASSMLQLLSKKFLKKKLLPAAPIHLWLLKRGWEEPKIVMRAWLLGFLLGVLGVYLALVQ
jgi:phospho-N-acetylmuramoyl-pentapeptide-transferase